jgi:formylmethanofuran dehydrogenase subunit E
MRIGTRFNKGMKPNCVLCGEMIISAKKSHRMFCDVCREKKRVAYAEEWRRKHNVG